ncbi:FAD-dependent oxidoreductase [Pedobacter sp. Hv1]|uniref:FAD-dependent oxidoreductase n=1 Tax=Pedobacter sp. Hv1 TaxID=1740090 RepID=UPI0006D8BA61|nr:FAD-dependent oxidoreductase [Pedobacter sp. Hv1]KQC01924.1 FAD-dependent oxidoreductase [Pedobacter sp. Hv1]
MNYLRHLFLTYVLCTTAILAQAQSEINTSLLIIGGGASGTTAGIQASRMGVQTIIVEETDWLGGMLTAAGVSAIDGNHQMPAGLWGEFRQKLYHYYGGAKAVETGWVSNTLFEPSVGNKLLKELAKEANLAIWYQSQWLNVQKTTNGWTVSVKKANKTYKINAQLLIDATELGDVMAAVGAPYRIGMDSRSVTGESYAPEQANDIIQDLTYVAILKDFGAGADKTIKKPAGYDPTIFEHSCDVADPAAKDNTPIIDCSKMITYGKLPNGKYMINWPKNGNDIYLNIIEKSPKERSEALKEAKLHTLRFIYYLQTVMGFKHLGLADDEFPTADRLPMIPYNRESRRLKGQVDLTLPFVAQPYQQKEAYYRTGIAVGDYTIDHHHLKNPAAPAIDFVKIKVPAYNVPLGSLVPENTKGLIVAEKSIGVSNIVAGATRLQPVVLGIGQAAGALAAVAIKNNVDPAAVNIREVQQALLSSKAYIMPFIDVKPEDSNFDAIQRIGATGILQGTGISYKWANQMWFYPQHPISEATFIQGLKTYYPAIAEVAASGKDLDVDFFATVIPMLNKQIGKETIVTDLASLKKQDQKPNSPTINRGELAVLLDKYLKPFAVEVNFNGRLMQSKITK